MARDFRTSDEGMTVVTAGGDKVGTIEKVEGNMAHVRPKQSLSRSIRRRLGWAEDDGDTFELTHEQVRDISGDEVRLKE